MGFVLIARGQPCQGQFMTDTHSTKNWRDPYKSPEAVGSLGLVRGFHHYSRMPGSLDANPAQDEFDFYAIGSAFE